MPAHVQCAQAALGRLLRSRSGGDYQNETCMGYHVAGMDGLV